MLVPFFFALFFFDTKKNAVMRGNLLVIKYFSYFCLSNKYLKDFKF